MGKHREGRQIITGEYLNYMWDEDDVEAIIHLVNTGHTETQIAELTDRKMLELYVLLDDLLRQRKIPRKNNKLACCSGGYKL